MNDYEKEAKEYAEKYNLSISCKYPGWNDSEDAFRHAYMQASFSLKHNDNFAKFIANSYENIAGTIQGQSRAEKNMDLWNNHIGRLIANELKKHYGISLNNMTEKQLNDLIAKKVVQKMRNGELITSPTDKRKYTGFASDVDSSSSGGDSPKYMDKNGNRVYTREDLHNMPKEEENTNHDAIMKQYHKMGIPTQAEIKTSLNKTRPQTLSEMRDISNMGDHWVTINGNHVLMN